MALLHASPREPAPHAFSFWEVWEGVCGWGTGRTLIFFKLQYILSQSLKQVIRTYYLLLIQNFVSIHPPSKEEKIKFIV